MVFPRTELHAIRRERKIAAFMMGDMDAVKVYVAYLVDGLKMNKDTPMVKPLRQNEGLAVMHHLPALDPSLEPRKLGFHRERHDDRIGIIFVVGRVLVQSKIPRTI